MMLVSLAGCQQRLADTVLRGEDAYKAIPAAKVGEVLPDYRIGPLDALDVTVFQEPDLSLKTTRVDAGGQIIMPLIGRIQAAGQTAPELAKSIEGALGQKYLRSPQVTVSVVSAMSQRVTVEGSVNNPGVFEIQGQTSLLESLAMAKGVTRTAALGQVVVFRTINGQRNAAVFNVTDIRRGAAQDPQILGNDLVVVGFSSLKAGWRDFLSTSPLLTVFRPF